MFCIKIRNFKKLSFAAVAHFFTKSSSFRANLSTVKNIVFNYTFLIKMKRRVDCYEHPYHLPLLQ
jgi:hypothetical protein